MPDSISKRREVAPALLICAAAVLPYLNALSNGFVYDDLYLVLGNTRLGGLGSIPAIFGTGYWQDGGGLYRPLTMLSFLLEHMAAGSRPFLYHLDNVLLHLGCSLIVYAILKPLLKGRHAALFASILFAVRPVHTEAVAWVSGRAELLCGLFMLASFQLYLKDPAGRPSASLSYAFFFLALMSKESAVILPVLLAAYVLLFSPGQNLPARFRRLIGLYPYAVVFLVYMLIRYSVIGEMGPAGKEATLGNFSPYQVFLVMCESLFHYMRLGFFPVSLSADYLFYPAKSVLYYRVAVPIVITALVFVSAWRIAEKSRPALFGILWFYIALLPVSNIIRIGHIMSERAMYIPSVGICIILGIWFSAAYEGASINRAKYFVAAMFVLAAVLLAAGTVNRNPVWKDQKEFSKRVIKMWKRRIKLTPGYAPYYSALAREYINRGDYGPEAEDAAREAIRLDDKDFSAHYCLAMVYMDKGQLADALDEVNTSLGLHGSA
jgi:protein O-mannosyl-transferase